MSSPLTVISSMATRALLVELAASFEAGTGQAVAVESVGGVDAARRVRAGEAFDVVVLAQTAIDDLIAAGRIDGARVAIVRSGVAMAVKAGAPHPDIANEDAVRRAVAAAKSLGYSTGPSGVHLAKLFARWGLADSVAARLVQAPPGVPVGKLVAEGQVELGFQQLSELMNLPGIDVLGPLPPAIQTMTVFAGGVANTSARPDAARALLTFVAAPATAGVKVRHGMEPA